MAFIKGWRKCTFRELRCGSWYHLKSKMDEVQLGSHCEVIALTAGLHQYIRCSPWKSGGPGSLLFLAYPTARTTTGNADCGTLLHSLDELFQLFSRNPNKETWKMRLLLSGASMDVTRYNWVHELIHVLWGNELKVLTVDTDLALSASTYFY